MKETGGIIINKYGAVDVEEIMSLYRRVGRLENIINNMAEVNDYQGSGMDRESVYQYIHDTSTKIWCLSESIKKMKELTKCDDYEYQTTPETVKLVKKQCKQAKDE